MAPSNGCATSCYVAPPNERKESSQWHKNTQTGERDICNTCYNKQRAVEMAPSNGVCSVREEGEFTLAQKYRYGRKRYLCAVLQKSTCYRNGTIERVCSVREEGEFTLAQKYRYGRKRYLCCVLPKSTCYRNGTTERVCSVLEEGEFTMAQKYRDGRKRYLCCVLQ